MKAKYKINRQGYKRIYKAIKNIVNNDSKVACSSLTVSGDDRKIGQATSRVWKRKRRWRETSPLSLPDPARRSPGDICQFFLSCS